MLKIMFFVVMLVLPFHVAVADATLEFGSCVRKTNTDKIICSFTITTSSDHSAAYMRATNTRIFDNHGLEHKGVRASISSKSGREVNIGLISDITVPASIEFHNMQDVEYFAVLDIVVSISGGNLRVRDVAILSTEEDE